MRSIASGLLAGCAAAALCSAQADQLPQRSPESSSEPVNASDFDLPQWPAPQPLNTYGHTGLLEMPSARMMNDGEFAITIANAPETLRTSLTFQVFPWLEAGFRYSRIDNYLMNSDDPEDIEPGERKDLLDRSFSLKLRLWDESEYMPAIAVGVQDILGTGVYGGEYVVASKSIGDFDFTLGLGWGRMGSVGMFRNPFSIIDDRFDTRPPFIPGENTGGKPVFDSLFRGRDVSLFGGVVWQTPIDGLQAIVEYSGDEYRTEMERDLYEPESQFNFGLSYRVDELLDASLSYLYGDTISFRVSLRFDPAVEMMKVLDPSPLPPSVRPPEQRPRTVARGVPGQAEPVIDLTGLKGIRLASASDWSLAEYAETGNGLIAQAESGGSMQEIMNSGRWFEVPAIRKQMVDSLTKLGREQNLGIQAIDLKSNYVSIYYDNERYYRETDHMHRLLRVLTTLPPSVEHFYMTSLVDGFPSTEVLVSRTSYENAVQQFATVDDLLSYTRISPGGLSVPDDALWVGEEYPRFDWSISPQPRTLLFDPDQPLRIGVQVNLSGSVEFEGGWKIEGTLSSDLIDTISEPRRGNSVLRHVRTDFRMYRDEGQHGIQSLIVSKIGKISPEVFYEVKAGYLEDMYAGVGGEVVWRPQGSKVAYGANLYVLKQRSYDRLFGFLGEDEILDAQALNAGDFDPTDPEDMRLRCDPVNPNETCDTGAIVTGHVSLYWQDAIWRGVNVNVHAGRYLAGDWGGTVEITRKFDSGVEIGAFATLTDVPFDDFGEGSFDKGLIIRVPFGWVTPFNTQYEAGTYLNALTRDGGARLYEKNPLWEKLRRTNEAEITRTWALDVTPGL